MNQTGALGFRFPGKQQKLVLRTPLSDPTHHHHGLDVASPSWTQPRKAVLADRALPWKLEWWRREPFILQMLWGWDQAEPSASCLRPGVCDSGGGHPNVRFLSK